MLTTHSIKRWALALLLALPIAVPLAASAQNEGAPGAVKHQSKLYIVQMIDAPVAAYTGGVPGLRATKPARGQKINPLSNDVVRYGDYLTAKHDDALRRVGGATKAYSYKYSFNGFAAELSDGQVAALRNDASVVNVSKDEMRTMDTSSTPAFLGLSAPGGLWSMLSGNANGNPIIANGPNSGGAGEGVIIGIVDTGIWPENPSFSDRDANGKLVYQQIPGWHGKCIPGESFNASNCNQKLIAAQWYGAGFGGEAGVKALFPYELWSARGAAGHGSHTSGTAAGNFNVPAIVNGNSLGNVSGMAPRARIAMYKVCWGIGGAPAGCFNSDSVAAIDQAVADGVDVINFSISGSRTSSLDPVEVAFLFAAEAGVFVAASAGNDGPGASTVAHNSPWLATVAAGTKDRVWQATATLGNGNVYTGVGLGAAVPSSPLILSTNAGLSGADATAVRLCFTAADNGGAAVLDPAKVAGKIVVCDRGTNARVSKSLAVQQAGGIGMILTNTSPNSLNADLHSVPTVHLADTDHSAVWTYGATPNPTASLSAGIQVLAIAPDVAAFSSRGPALAGAGDLLKPDIMAPGVDVLAAMSPIEVGRDFDFLSGTSMSSPHIAGIAALFKQKYPNWSPAAIKSALMTTASQTRNNNTPIAGGAFAYGAGQVVPNSGANPGLVYDSGFDDWRGFLRSQGLCTFCFGAAPAPVFDTSDLNYPSIAIGSLAGAQTVTRTVTNVGGTSETYAFSYTGLAGITVGLPAGFTIAPGATKTFGITFTTDTAAPNVYVQGAIVLTGSNGHVVRSPVVLRPVALAAPAEVNGSYNVTFGYTGPFSATARGLIPPTKTGSVATGEWTLSSRPGTTYARFSLFNTEVSQPSDLDLEVRGPAPSTALVGSSGGGTSNEEVNLLNLAAGDYTVRVVGFAVPVGSANFTLFDWALGSTAAGNMTVVAPASAVLGTTSPITLGFSGLAPATKYLGSVAYSGVAGLPNPTIVRVILLIKQSTFRLPSWTPREQSSGLFFVIIESTSARISNFCGVSVNAWSSN
jgi:subtilisin family serine protease